ncbi:uncharacterized protein LY89DRAFT_681077 [Mollisia scopiformis]|uniref:Uncharacterized protein n=1 Tax=Mollisia scopiformis TaxID=149040 RepID=A0A194XNE0_MOLSC|nr:uncharacterized protein LY89DRAFT_681077 [Mollisia scopiformis]KUJ21624.1 hypothetical protein LY89DRAFT_681077 [Mollisia scopiformis]
MPALPPQILQRMGEVAVIIPRDLSQSDIVEAFIVVFVSVFGVGGAIWYANKHC